MSTFLHFIFCLVSTQWGKEMKNWGFEWQDWRREAHGWRVNDGNLGLGGISLAQNYEGILPCGHVCLPEAKTRKENLHVVFQPLFIVSWGATAAMATAKAVLDCQAMKGKPCSLAEVQAKAFLHERMAPSVAHLQSSPSIITRGTSPLVVIIRASFGFQNLFHHPSSVQPITFSCWTEENHFPFRRQIRASFQCTLNQLSHL